VCRRLLLLALAILAIGSPVLADDESSAGRVGDVEVSPAPDGRVNWSPKEIVLKFPSPPLGVQVELSTADGYPLPPAAPLSVEGDVLRYPNPQIYAGEYRVAWDGPHAGSYSFKVVMSGTFESVGPADSSAASSPGQSVGDDSDSAVALRWVLPSMLFLLMVVVLLRRRPVVALAVVVAVFAGGFSVWYFSDSVSARTECLPLSGEERLGCLNAAVLAGYDTGGVDAVVSALKDLDNDTRFRSEYGENVCHTVAHMAARVVVAREGSISKVATSADRLCASGFLHGALEGGAVFVTNEVYANEVLGICGDDRDNAALECSHGIGHGLALRLNSRLPEASDVCLLLPNEEQVVQCVLGASMLSGGWVGNMAARNADPAAFTPPGLDAGTIGEVCLYENLAAVPDRFRACLEGLFFYMKPGVEVVAKLPQPWNSVERIADWCIEVTADKPQLLEPCFSGVGSASALRLSADPSTLADPCKKAPSDVTLETCVLAVVTQVRNNQDVSPPRPVFEAVCSDVAGPVASRCLDAVDRLIAR